MNDDTPPDRVLLVDDNPINLNVLYEALQDEGYELLIACSGEEALNIAEVAQPSLILLDIMMPGLNGYETCEKLKANPKTRDSVVIYLSANSETESKLKAFDTGAVDYVSKPFSFEEVVARVRTHLKYYHERRALRAKVGAGFTEWAEHDLEKKITEGESETVEFKSTLRCNLHTAKNDKRMENACLKSIAAFLNSEGGLLVIGVDDDGHPVGLEKDSFPNEDRYLLHLNTLITTHLGGEVAQFTKTAIRPIPGGRVVAVECLRSPNPVFFRRGNEEHFFVRSGPSTQSLTASEVLAYLDGRK